MKPEQKKAQQLTEEDLKQTAGGKIPRPEGELPANELDNVSGGITIKRPTKVSVVETE
jgi:hypothetical protein